MKTISLPASALEALINTGACEVRKPVAKSPAIQPDPIKSEWWFDTDSYGYENIGALVFGFYDRKRTYRFPWGGPGEFVQVKDSRRRCEIMAVDVVAGRKKYNWLIKLRLI